MEEVDMSTVGPISSGSKLPDGVTRRTHFKFRSKERNYQVFYVIPELEPARMWKKRLAQRYKEAKQKLGLGNIVVYDNPDEPDYNGRLYIIHTITPDGQRVNLIRLDAPTGAVFGCNISDIREPVESDPQHHILYHEIAQSPVSYPLSTDSVTKIRISNDEDGGAETPWAFKDPADELQVMFLANNAVHLFPFTSWGRRVSSRSLDGGELRAERLWMYHPEAIEAMKEHDMIHMEGDRMYLTAKYNSEE